MFNNILVAYDGSSSSRAATQQAFELKQWAARTVREGASLASSDLNVHTVTRSGHIGEEIVAEIETGGYDLVVLGSRGRGRLTSELFGSANGYVHFHSRIPL